MADGAGAEGGGPFDPLPLPDNFEDVLHLLDLSGLNNAEPVPPPPPAAAPVHNVDHTACSRGCSGDDLLDWSAMLDNYPIGDGAPSATAAPPSGLPVHGGPSTSTSSAAQQADVLDCTGCQVLREVVHSNGFEATKLCIHGEAGVFYHATLDVYLINSEGLAPALTHHSNVDFSGRYYEWVKHYLTDYALRRAGGNFAVVHDSLAAFHDVLCTTMNRGSHVDDAHTGAAARNGGDRLIIDADAIQPTIQGYVQPASGPSQPSYTTDVERPFRSVVRTALAIQRERTGKLQLHDIAPYFHLPIAKAATKLDICPTALKGICRKYGVPRWPQRKVRSIDRQIAKLTRSGNGDAARNEIERLSASRRRIFAGLE